MNNTPIFKKLVLTGASILAIAFFLKSTVIDAWMQQLMLPNLSKINKLMYEDQHKRKVARWGSSYFASFHIQKYFKEHEYEQPVILFEPNEYYKKNNIKFKAPEPITFYYFTGLRGMWMNSNHLDDATHYVTVSNKGIFIHEIKSPAVLDSVLNVYKNYKVTL